jgi:hypothetical protein
MFVHTDGRTPAGSCRVCPISDCRKREATFDGRIEWTFENITDNEKHGFQTG